jgi:flavin reductase (DIM6/NTAB) family NADH-FMN oxidoreductase RutF
MKFGARHVHFDFSALSARDRYKLLIGTVIPRPIAFVTTVDEHGRVNAAPFSFFNCLSADPAIVAIGVENHADMTFKDTARNIRRTEEFTINIVDDAMVDGMNVCAVAFPPDVDELAAARLTAVPGTHVRCPRIGEAPASLECRRYLTLEVGRSREIILGEVLAVFVREGVVDRSKKYVDQRAMDAIGRMGGDGYALTRDYFDLPTPSLAQWERREVPRRKPRNADNEIATGSLADRPAATEAGEPGSAVKADIGIASQQE